VSKKQYKVNLNSMDKKWNKALNYHLDVLTDHWTIKNETAIIIITLIEQLNSLLEIFEEENLDVKI